MSSVSNSELPSAALFVPGEPRNGVPTLGSLLRLGGYTEIEAELSSVDPRQYVETETSNAKHEGILLATDGHILQRAGRRLAVDADGAISLNAAEEIRLSSDRAFTARSSGPLAIETSDGAPISIKADDGGGKVSITGSEVKVKSTGTHWKLSMSNKIDIVAGANFSMVMGAVFSSVIGARLEFQAAFHLRLSPSLRMELHGSKFSYTRYSYEKKGIDYLKKEVERKETEVRLAAERLVLQQREINIENAREAFQKNNLISHQANIGQSRFRSNSVGGGVCLVSYQNNINNNEYNSFN